MTTEQKAKAYDEVLNKLRRFIAKGVDPLITRADVQDFFPELAESEDERIRKRIIHALHGDVLDIEETNKAIAWLEKQGEHDKFIDSIQVGDKVTRNQDGVLVNLSQLNRVAKKNEKQGEQKSIDDLTQQEAMDIAVAKCFEQGEQKPINNQFTPEQASVLDKHIV